MDLQAWHIRVCQEGHIIDGHDRLVRRTCNAAGNEAVIDPIADEDLLIDWLAIPSRTVNGIPGSPEQS